jgi:uncharacterized protein (DUF927 family)
VPLYLDELHLVDRKFLGNAIYMLTQGEGKRSMRADRTARPPHAIRTGFISAGELSVRDALESGGANVYGGMIVRCADIPLRDEDCPNADYVNNLKAVCARYYGTAGPAFVKQITEMVNDGGDEGPWTRNDLRDFWLATLHKVTDGLDLTDDGQRVAKRFALAAAAGEIACAESDTFPFEPGTPTRAAREILNRWSRDFRTLSEAQRAIANIAKFIQRNRRRFSQVNGTTESPVANQVGFHVSGVRSARLGDSFYAFYTQGLTEALAGCNYDAALRELKSRGLLRLDKDGRHPKLTQKNSERERVIWLNARILEEPEAE